MSGSKLAAALLELGRAAFVGDRDREMRAKEEILRLAAVGSDIMARRETAPPETSKPIKVEARPARPALRLATPPAMFHASVSERRRTHSGVRGVIDGKPARLYRGNGYRSIARALAKEGRIEWRPASDGRGGVGFWLTAAEAKTVRAVHASLYEERERAAQ